MNPTGEVTWNATVLYAFAGGTDGSDPWGNLVFGPNGDLYGTTQHGGGGNCGDNNPGCGTVFQLTPESGGQWTETVLHRFRDDSHGSQPIGALLLDSSGNIYGTTDGNNYRGDVVFKLTESGGQWTEQVLDAFESRDAAFPMAPPTLASSGKIYGTTSGEGPYGHGGVFQLTPTGRDGWHEDMIYSFNGKDGANAFASVVLDGKGNLYGTTSDGGANGCGTIFELSPVGHGQWRETLLHSFDGSDGCSPRDLVFDAEGNLYGTTANSGAFGQGNVFEMSPSSKGGWSEATLYSFTGGSDGASPGTTLIFDNTGNLYGMTYYGGSGACNDGYDIGCGVVFELSPSGQGNWTESVLYSFNVGNDAQNPLAGLVFDGSGNLYGTTVNGGTVGIGAVFELMPTSGGWSESVLYSFQATTDGIYPDCTLVLDAKGNLYGTTPEYKNFGDTTFQLSLSNGVWTEATLYTFGSGHDGADPRGGVVSDGAGHLYGTTEGGGLLGAGVVFELTP